MERGNKHAGRLALSIFFMIAGFYLLSLEYTFIGLTVVGIGIWLFGVTM